MGGRVFDWFCTVLSTFFGTYATVKVMKIRNTYIAVIHRIFQFVVIAYIALYIVWIRKGYQDVQEPRGSSIIKVKGVARISIGKLNFAGGKLRDKVREALWDSADYLIPPFENNAFFIATRKIITHDQTVGICPSALNNKLFCNSTYNPCKQGTPTSNSFGFMTGNCVPSQENNKRNVCEINAWCPEEFSRSTVYKINTDDLQNFTVFLKTMVAFTNYNIKIRTVKDNTNFSCRFNSFTDRRCPIFSIGYILQKLLDQDHKIDLLALYHYGGLIEIQQNWKCNFDFDAKGKECFPTFTFNLLQSGGDALSPGINYRFAEKQYVNGREHRTLTKIYGLRFVVSIRGKGRRFDIVHLFVAIGSGVGYMMIGEIICDLILMYAHKYREEYRQNKIKILKLNQANKKNSKIAKLVITPDLEQPLTSSQRTNEFAL